MTTTRDSCASLTPYHSIDVPSSSSPGLCYRLVVPYPEAEIHEIVCQCVGYVYRGSCRHQDEADRLRCRWRGETGDVHDRCPDCGGPVLTEVVSFD